MPTHYETLGVPETATQEEITEAYEKLAAKYRPDTNLSPEAREILQELTQAHDELKDPDTRTSYDLRLKSQKSTNYDWSDYSPGKLLAKQEAEKEASQLAQIWQQINSNLTTFERDMRNFIANRNFADENEFSAAIKARIFPNTTGLSSSDKKKLNQIAEIAGDLFTKYQKQNEKQTSTLIGRLGNQIKSWFGKDVYSKFARELGQNLKAGIGAALDHHGLPRGGRGR